MQDRRKQPRKDLMSYSQVHDLHSGKLIGYLGDLNQYGAMVITDDKVAGNSNLMISIELPELPKIDDASMNISVRVAWCHQDLSPEYFNVGLEFSSISAKQMNIILAVIENYEFRRQSPNYPMHPNELE
ncbi:MAG: PilZ domain-containing protein [Chloroflexota bacterium]